MTPLSDNDIREMLRDNNGDNPVTPPRFIFHVTPSSNLESILASGLEIRSDNPQDRFPDRVYFSGYLGDAGRIASQLRKALILARQRKRNWREEYAVIRIDTHFLPDHVFKIDPYFPGGGYTDQPIGTEAIIILGSVSFGARGMPIVVFHEDIEQRLDGDHETDSDLSSSGPTP